MDFLFLFQGGGSQLGGQRQIYGLARHLFLDQMWSSYEPTGNGSQT